MPEKSRRAFFFFSLLLFGCAPKVEIPQNVRPFVDEFVRESEIRNTKVEIKNLVIKFVDLPGPEAGICVSELLSTPEIRLDSKSWDDENGLYAWAPDRQHAYRENLLFHELGHCVLNQVHRDYGIMHPDMIDPVAFSAQRADFLDELFQRYESDQTLWGKVDGHPHRFPHEAVFRMGCGAVQVLITNSQARSMSVAR